MGRNILRAGAFALMLDMATSASAYRVYGGQDCGEWIRSGSLVGHAWLTGFISGINAAYTV